MLSESLRFCAKAVLTTHPGSATSHAISGQTTVVTVPTQDGLQVVIPLFCDQKGDEPFARSIVLAMTDEVSPRQHHHPKYTLWEPKV